MPVMVTLDILQSMSSHNSLQNIEAQLFLRHKKEKPKLRPKSRPVRTHTLNVFQGPRKWIPFIHKNIKPHPFRPGKTEFKSIPNVQILLYQ